MCCKEDQAEIQQQSSRVHLHNGSELPLSGLNGDDLAAELFRTRRNPNRRRGPPQGPSPYDYQLDDSTSRSTTGSSTATPTTMPRPGAQADRLPPTYPTQTTIAQATRILLREYSRYQIDPGPSLSGLPLVSSTDTLPLYEPRCSSLASTTRGRPHTADSALSGASGGAGAGGAARRMGTGWSAISQYSGPPPPAYRSVVDLRQARGRLVGSSAR